MNELFDLLRVKALKLFGDNGLLDQMVTVKARVLSTEEAIGNPESDDFPLQKGKERLMQATFGKAVGQAFTDRFGDFEGTLKKVLGMPLENNYRRAVFIATVNAVLHHLGRAQGTIHCRDQEPVECAEQLVAYLQEKHPGARIGQVGLQPRMLEAVSKEFTVRLLDLDPENIGTRKFGVMVEGPEAASEVLEWANTLLVTGSTVVNGTIEQFLVDKPVIFYGATVAGTASLMGWERFCPCGH